LVDPAGGTEEEKQEQLLLLRAVEEDIQRIRRQKEALALECAAFKDELTYQPHLLY
jgi:hypothetical protein